MEELCELRCGISLNSTAHCGQSQLSCSKSSTDRKSTLLFKISDILSVASLGWVSPVFFLKNWPPFFCHHPLPLMQCHPYLFSWKSWRPFFLLITITFYHIYWFQSGVTPLQVSPCTIFTCQTSFVDYSL